MSLRPSWLPTAKYVVFKAGPCYALQPSNGPTPGTCDQSGLRLGFAPKLSGSLSATVALPISNDLEIIGVVSPRFESSSWRDFVNDPVSRQDLYAKIDARLALAAQSGKWEIALIGRNLTDHLTNAYGNTAGLANIFLDPGARATVVEPPRNLSMQVRLNF